MKFLLIDTVHPSLPGLLQEAGHQCAAGESLTRPEILKVIPGYDGIIIRSRILIDREFLDQAVRLKVIGRIGAGMECIDVNYASAKKIACLNSPEGNRDAVGEHAIGMLLMLFNKLHKANAEVKQGLWIREANRGTELAAKTVGIVGYGNMGNAFAKKLSGFGCNVLAYDKYKSNFSDAFAREASMDEIFEQTDILSLHVPLTPETTFLADDAYINSFRKNIYIVNTARGKCIRTTDLVKNLRSGKVRGACLDTIEYEETSFEKFDARIPGSEKNPDWEYLCSSDQVVLSPHIAGWTVESLEKLARILAGKIISHFR